MSASSDPPSGPAAPGFRGKQVGVAIGMAVGLVVTIAAFLWSGRATHDMRLVDPVAVWAAGSASAGAWLALGVALLARHRFFAPADIDGAGLTPGTPTARALQGLIQNTLEQAVLAALAYAASLLVEPAGSPALVTTCAILFAAGRLLFFVGYARGAAARALGFALTFYPTVGLIALAAPKLVRFLAVTAGF